MIRQLGQDVPRMLDLSAPLAIQSKSLFKNPKFSGRSEDSCSIFLSMCLIFYSFNPMIFHKPVFLFPLFFLKGEIDIDTSFFFTKYFCPIDHSIFQLPCFLVSVCLNRYRYGKPDISLPLSPIHLFPRELFKSTVMIIQYRFG